MKHTCHAAGCSERVPPEMLMCKKHWFMVSQEIRNRVWSHYRNGQCDDLKITHDYANAARDAVRCVAVKEGRSEESIKAACAVYDMLAPARE